jgi:hypothetical protein
MAVAINIQVNKISRGLNLYPLSGSGYVYFVILHGLVFYNVVIPDCRNPDAKDGKPYKHIHVFWISAIPADMTASLTIATYNKR